MDSSLKSAICKWYWQLGAEFTGDEFINSKMGRGLTGMENMDMHTVLWMENFISRDLMQDISQLKHMSDIWMLILYATSHYHRIQFGGKIS